MAEPLSLLLELSRTRDAVGPYALQFEPQLYTFHWPDGLLEQRELPWSQDLLDALAGHYPPDQAAQRLELIGDVLTRFVEGPGWSRLVAEIEAAQARGAPIHLTVRSNAAELYALPWELLSLGATGRMLGEVPDILVRYAWPGARVQARVPAPPKEGGTLLFAWAAPEGAVPMSDHAESIQRVTAEAGLLLHVLPRASLPAIVARLRSAAEEGEPVRVLHLLCHGAAAGDSWGLLLHGEDGLADLVDPGRLRAALAPYGGALRLVVIMACGGQSMGALSCHLGSCAVELHRAGIEAVVGARVPLSLAVSNAFTAAFYRELVETPRSVEGAWRVASREVLLAHPRRDWVALQLFAHGEYDEDTRPITFKPYRGLLTFERRHRRFFFGRERDVTLVMDRLERAFSGACPRFQVLLGSSGSGKSSLIRAGVLARPMAVEGRPIVGLALDPREPDAGLRGLLRAMRERRQEPRDLRTEPRADDVLRETLQLLVADPASRYLIVVDPLDGLLTSKASETARRELLAALWTLATLVNDVVVLCALRTDLVDRVADLPLDPDGKRLGDILTDDAHRLVIEPIPAERLPDVIGLPAAQAGFSFEAGLIDTLLAEAGRECVALPLLQCVLDELWRRRSEDRFTFAAYHEIGRFQGALEGTVEAVLADMSLDERTQARRILVRLVDHESGPLDGAPSARAVRVEDVRPHDPSGCEHFDRALDVLVGRWLVVRAEHAPGEVLVHLAHEALIANWPALREWVRADHELLAALDLLRTRGRQWRAQRDPALLLEGGELQGALALRKDQASELDTVIWAYVQESEAAAERRDAEARQAALREQVRRRRRAVRAAVITSLVAVVMLALALFAARERQRALDALLSNRLVTARGLLADGQDAAALAEALRAWDLFQRPGAALPDGESRVGGLLSEVVTAARLRVVGRLHELGVADVALCTDPAGASSGVVVSGGLDRRVAFWSTEGRLLHATDRLPRPVRAVAIAPGCAQAAVALEDATVRTYELTRFEELRSPVFTELNVVDTAYDGQGLLTLDTTGRLFRWTAAMDQRTLLYDAEDTATSLDARDGWIVLGVQRETGSNLSEGHLMVWAPGATEHKTYLVSDRTVNAVALLRRPPDRMLALVGGSRGAVLALNLVTEAWMPEAWSSHRRQISDIDVALDAGAVATGSDDGATVVAQADHVVTTSLTPLSRRVGAVVAGPGGASAIVGGADGGLRFYALNPPGVEDLARHQDAVSGVVVLADGVVLSAAEDGRLLSTGASPARTYEGALVSLAVWRGDEVYLAVRGSKRIARWPVTSADADTVCALQTELNDLATGPGGGLVAWAGRDGSAGICAQREAAPRPLLEVSPDGYEALSVAVSPDGATLAVGRTDGSIHLLPLGAGRRILLAAHAGAVSDLVYAPDGRLFSAGSEGTVAAWNSDGGQSLQRFDVQGHAPLVLAMSNAAPWTLAVGGDDGAVRIFGLGGQLYSTRPLHSGPVTALAYAPDGRTLSSGGADRRVRRWPVRLNEPEYWAGLACGLLPAELVAREVPDRHTLCAAVGPSPAPGPALE